MDNADSPVRAGLDETDAMARAYGALVDLPLTARLRCCQWVYDKVQSDVADGPPF